MGGIACLALSFGEARAFTDAQLAVLQDLADAAAERLLAVPPWSASFKEEAPDR